MGPNTRQRVSIEVRRAERELFFWTAREALRLVILLATVTYFVVSLVDGRLPGAAQVLRAIGGP